MEEDGVRSASPDERKSDFDVLLAEAHRIKEEGNNVFRSEDYKKAVSFYTRCLDCVKKARAALKNQSGAKSEKAQSHATGTSLPFPPTEGEFSPYSAETAGELLPQTAKFPPERGGDVPDKAFPPTDTAKFLAEPLKDKTTHLDTLETQVLCNRALCNFRLHFFKCAEDDCTAALAVDESNVKALYRRACAREELQRFEDCLCDLQLLLKRGRTSETANLQQMLRRVREKLLRREQLERDQQEPQALIVAALSTDSRDKCLSSAERVVSVKKATAFLHANSAARVRFCKEGALLRLADFLANAPEARPQQEEQKKKKNLDEAQTRHEKDKVEETVPLTAALEAACWELLLRCVVDEEADEKQQQERKKKFSTGGNVPGSAEKVTEKRQKDTHCQGAYEGFACISCLRQKWTSEQLLLRLRRLLSPQTKKCSNKTSRCGTEISFDKKGSTDNVARSLETAEVEKRDTHEEERFPEDGRRADASAADECEKAEKRDDVVVEENAEDSCIRASCSLLRLMGQLEKVSAKCFEDDTAFCTACLLGMQYTGSVEVRLAALDAAAAVATARRTLAIHEAPVLALRQNIEKLLEELLQQFEESVQSGLIEEDYEKTNKKGEHRQPQLGDTSSLHKEEGNRQRLLGDSSYLQKAEAGAQRERLQAQIECLLVTVISLLVDKNRALPPLFAATHRSRDSSDGRYVQKREEEETAKTQKHQTAAKTAETDTDRLFEQLLTPYLPLSTSMLPLKESSSAGKGESVKGSSHSRRKSSEDLEANTWSRNSCADKDISKRRYTGSLLMWKGSDGAEETVIRQIVGLKVLRLLLPAARDEVSRFLINDTCGVLRFAVAAAADNEGVRLAHTPRMFWLQQQAAAADLLIPAMDFPELRHKLLQIGGLQALAAALSSCCSELCTREEKASLAPFSVAVTIETTMRWVLCGKIAAILARLAVHHENVRVEVFDFVNFYDILSKLLEHWEQQQHRSTGSSPRVDTSSTLKTREEKEVESAAAIINTPTAIQAERVPRGLRAVIADLEQHAICQDFSQVFCFVSLHGSFKKSLTDDKEGGMLPRLVRLLDAAFVAAQSSNTTKGKGNSSSRNLVLFLLLQGLSNLMKSRDDRQRRPCCARGNRAGPQLDEEQQQQLEEFFSRLPPEAQPPRNGQIDAGDSEVATALKERLAGCGIVRILTGIIMSNLKAAATAAAQKEEEAEHYRINTGSVAATAAAAALQQQLSPNALIAAVDVLSALSAPPVHRGCVVQEGGLRTLLAVIPFLEKSGSAYEAEQRDARQAVARLCISVNPSLMTYQETLEAITYVVPLLRDEHELLQYEAALAVTNLTSSAIEAQNHAWHLGAWSALEDLLFSENPLLRAAGLEGWCNLSASYLVQDAIGSRCEELWKAECKNRSSAIQDSTAVGKPKPQAATSEDSNVETSKTQAATQTNELAVVSSSEYEMQYLKILLAYCLEDENMRARHAAIAALAMLVEDCRTAAAVVRSNNFSNLFRCLDNAELIQAEERNDESERRYEGDTLILRIVATLNNLWASLKDAEDKYGCNFEVLTERLRTVLVRNNHKLKGVSSALAQEICAA